MKKLSSLVGLLLTLTAWGWSFEMGNPPGIRPPKSATVTGAQPTGERLGGPVLDLRPARVTSGLGSTGLHPFTPGGLSTRGRLTRLSLLPLHGPPAPAPLPPGADLETTLALPPGPWSALRLEVDGLALRAGDGPWVPVDLAEIEVPLDDPDATTVLLSLQLSEPSLAALARGASPDALTDELTDGAQAVPSP